MTQPTKLQILGPYTPEHGGPYVWGDERSMSPCCVHSVVKGLAFISTECNSTPFLVAISRIKNALEVPVAREFWIVEYSDGIFNTCKSLSEAIAEKSGKAKIIHVREVLPGEDE